MGMMEQETMNNVLDYDYAKMSTLIHLFSSLAATKTFIVESSPFNINNNFIGSLSAFITDLRLYDKKIIWNEAFLNVITRHFRGLHRLGFPANRINMPLLVSCIEDSCNDLIIKNLDIGDKHQLQAQDLAMLFSRFQEIEIDSSLIDKYPQTNLLNKTKIKKLSIQSDTHNFFIKLLKNIPSSVNHLSIKNTTNSTNNLVIDVSQKSKFNTKNIKILELNGFDNNLKQIANVLNHTLFPNLERLYIVIKSNQYNDSYNKKTGPMREMNDNYNPLIIVERDINALIKNNNKVIIKAMHQSSKY